MRFHPAFFALPLLCFCLRTASADMRPVTIQNTGSKPIYKLYGWPSDLVPRTFNLLTAPLNPGDSRDISIEDAYNSCVFAFQADFNNPRKPTRAMRTRPKYIGMAFRDSINLCGSGKQKVVFR